MQQLAETGWQQMHQTLVEQGLSTETEPPGNGSKRRYLLFLVVASVLLFFVIDGHRFLPGNTKQNSSGHQSVSTVSPVIKPLPATPFQNQIHFRQDSINTVSIQKQIFRSQLNRLYSEYKLKKYNLSFSR